MKKIFVYDSAIFEVDVLICVGSSCQDIKKWVLKNAVKELKDFFQKNDISDNQQGTLHRISLSKNYYILYLKEFNFTWDDFGLLLHEIVHLKQYLFMDRGIKKELELEFEAYFIQNTFLRIRKQLTRFDKKLK
jgi:hypothetical protein